MKKSLCYIFLFVCLSLSHILMGQSAVSESAIENLHGKDKVLALHQLAGNYLKNDTKRAYKYAKEAVDLSDQIIHPNNHLLTPTDLPLKAISYFILGKVHVERAEYKEAQAYLSLARFEGEKLNYHKLDTEIDQYLKRLEQTETKGIGIGSFFKDKIGDLGLGEKIESTTQDINISASQRLAKSFEENDQYEKAIEQYLKLLNFAKDKGDWQEALILTEKIGYLHEQIFKYEEALEVLFRNGSHSRECLNNK